jgi:serine/threonine protein kinase
LFSLTAYENLKKIASGGMAEIYEGWQKSLQRKVAIKKLHSHFCQNKEMVKRFEQEARGAASLNHPNVVNVYDYGFYQDSYYIVMEFIEGTDLEKLLEKKVVSPLVGVMVLKEICQGLKYAHQQGIVHRDLKPANIMIDQNGVVKLTDFGISHFLGARLALTQPDQIVGTPLYMSPEQVAGEKIDQRSDIFSLGVVLYQILTGTTPFYAENTATVGQKILNEEYLSPLKIKPTLPQSLVLITAKCLLKKPERRYQQVEEVLKDFDAFLKKREVVDTRAELEKYIANPEQYLQERSSFKPKTESLSLERKTKKNLWPVGVGVIVVFALLFFGKIFLEPKSVKPAFEIKQAVEKTEAEILKEKPVPKPGQVIEKSSDKEPSSSQKKAVRSKPAVTKEKEPKKTKKSPLPSDLVRVNSKSPLEKPVSVEEKPAPIKKPVRVYLGSKPIAQVFINGKEIGKTPLFTSLLPGEYLVKLKSPITFEHQEKVIIPAEEENYHHPLFQLKLLPAYLKINPQKYQQVMVEGRIFKIPANGLVEIPFGKEGIEYKKTASYQVKLINHQVKVREIKLTPGKISLIE